VVAGVVLMPTYTFMTQADLTDLERTILERLESRDTCTPAEIAISLEADLKSVYQATDRLRDRELLERAGFNTCVLTDRGRDVVGSGRVSEP
jgi:Mn-dependent DtxR family transcriptional regulator